MEQSHEQEVILIITDISGYTRFMLSNRETLLHGQFIITKLTKAIIARSRSPWKSQNSKGDAVFPYAMKKDGDSWQETSSQIGQKLLSFLAAFSGKLLELDQSNTCLCTACTFAKNLSLKIVVHSGEALLYQIGKFEELSGVDVIIVHRLMKNSVPASEYILMTEAAYRDVQFPMEIPVTPGLESYDDIGKINTYVFLPVTTSEAAQSPEKKHYSSMFYRWKNKYSKAWKSKLMDLGWVRPPRFNNLPDDLGKS
jgi:Protein of unknown function (DUF2652)